MNCLQEFAPGDEDLIAFALDDEMLSQEAQSHVDQCAVCQQRLASIRETHAALLSRFYRHDCPDAVELSYYSAGGLLPGRRQAIASHLLDCPLCMTEVEDARRYLQEQPTEFPQAVSRPRALARRIFATQVTRPQLQFVVRSDERESAWPRQYKAETVDFSLHLSRTGSGEAMLIGILTSSDPNEDVDSLEGIEAALYAAPLPATANGHTPHKVPVLHTRVDDLGNLVFRPVLAGDYAIIISLPGREMIIEGISIDNGS